MTGMNKVISMKIGIKNKKYGQSSIQNHLGVLYEIIFGVTNRKIDISTTGFLGAMLSRAQFWMLQRTLIFSVSCLSCRDVSRIVPQAEHLKQEYP